MAVTRTAFVLLLPVLPPLPEAPAARGELQNITQWEAEHISYNHHTSSYLASHHYKTVIVYKSTVCLPCVLTLKCESWWCVWGSACAWVCTGRAWMAGLCSLSLTTVPFTVLQSTSSWLFPSFICNMLCHDLSVHAATSIIQ